MNVRKFYASTTREALRQVRDALGADAIILSNRQVAGGIEIMAVADRDVSLLAVGPEAEPASPPRAQPAPRAPEPSLTGNPLRTREALPPSPPPLTPLAPEAEEDEELPDNVVKDIIREIKFLRGMVEGQLAGVAWSDLQDRSPDKVEILRHVLAAGFSPALGRHLLDKMPPMDDFSRSLRWAKAALTHNLPVVSTEDDLVERGGIYALVGPTGVGKTTTVAKLAARCTLQHGPSSVVMLTTDSYRIGAHEQLRIYGKILGVPVYAIKDETDLQLTLSDMQHKHLILIDTVGMGQRDRRVAEQVELLCGQGRKVRRLLLLAATAQGHTLDDVVASYQGKGGAVERLAGCILTKIDESVSLGGVLDVVIRHRLPLHFVTNGQRVPEDMHLPNAHYLVDRAFKLAQEMTPFTLEEAEYPLIMGGSEPPVSKTQTLDFMREALRG